MLEARELRSDIEYRVFPRVRHVRHARHVLDTFDMLDTLAILGILYVTMNLRSSTYERTNLWDSDLRKLYIYIY
jgi:hypothetical protein